MNTPQSHSDLFNELASEASGLLKDLIRIPSLSREEDKTADLIAAYLTDRGIGNSRIGNNIIAKNSAFDPGKSTILLNSHHDTVKPNEGYTLDPFKPAERDGKLFGLGANDAGGSLVSLIAAFCHFYNQDLPVNLLLAATAEEEISGEGGVSSVLPDLPEICWGIVGEPTLMKMAVAEKGLMVLDCFAYGRSGHAARDEGENAIYKAMKDIEWFQTFVFPKVSDLLGPVKMSVTMVDAGYQHNVVPDKCHFVVDVRTTDAYANEETLDIIRSKIESEVKARSTRLNPSGLAPDSLLMEVAQKLGIETFGSPTLSDQALLPFPTCKMGPGDSARSHTADEFIYLDEIEAGIEGYIRFLEGIFEGLRF